MVLIQRRLDLPWVAGNYPAAAVAVYTSHLKRCFADPNRVYSVEPLNGTWVHLQTVGAEPAEYGELETDLPGERRNSDAAVAAKTKSVR